MGFVKECFGKYYEQVKEVVDTCGEEVEGQQVGEEQVEDVEGEYEEECGEEQEVETPDPTPHLPDQFPSDIPGNVKNFFNHVRTQSEDVRVLKSIL